MSIEMKYTCNICGAERGEANHWFEGPRPDETFYLRPFTGAGKDALDNPTHLCGSKCAHALLDRWLATGGPD